LGIGIEVSPSNRAECRICHKPIKKGEKRIVEDDQYYGFYSPRFYHVKCWIQRNAKFIKELLEALPESGTDLSFLRDAPC